MYKKLWHQLALVTLLASGMAVLWGFLAAWGINTYESRMRQGMTYEDLQVDTQGDAWIQTHQYYSNTGFETPQGQLPYRTLEGESIEIPLHDFWLSGCTMTHPASSIWRANLLQKNWRRRVSKIADTGREHWYLVHNGADAEAGRAYLVGYDLRTKLPVGYCSRQGFRAELPAEDQWFHLDGRNVGWGQGNIAVISRQKDPKISLATLDGWFEFTVKQRLFRTIDDTQPYLSVASCQIPKSIPLVAREKLSEAEKAALATFKVSTENFSPGWPLVFAARRQDSIVVQHRKQEQPYEFVIPEDYRERRIDFYFIAADHAVMNTSKGIGIHRESVLLTTNAAGEIQKSRPIAWAPSPPTNNLNGACFLMVAMPVFLVVSVFLLGVDPMQTNYHHVGWNDAGYLERVGMMLSDAWPPLLVLVILSAVLAWFALRWHQQYARPHAGAWTALVFLLGVPGFIAYWAYHRRPALETCPECNEKVPRDRDACAGCRQPFAEPRLLGTEVFV